MTITANLAKTIAKNNTYDFWEKEVAPLIYKASYEGNYKSSFIFRPSHISVAWLNDKAEAFGYAITWHNVTLANSHFILIWE